MRRVAVVLAGRADPDDARDQARDILDQKRYRPARVPKPFEGALHWLGDRLRPVTERVGDVLASWPGRLLLLGAVAAVTVLVARAIIRRRGGAGAATARRGAARRSDDDSLDPRTLEAAAADAERRGELDRAVRLRFRAGLLRLDAAGAIRFRPSITTGQVARRLRQPTFDDLATAFDAVAYGGRRASVEDVRAARERWPDVVASAAGSDE